MARTVRNVCCIGAGYVGGPTCAVIANKNRDITINIVDLNQERIDAWNSDQLPIFEPGLREIMEPFSDGETARQRLPNLIFSTDIDSAIEAADLIFISVNTPTKTVGHGAGKASDLLYVGAAARRIAEVATTDKIIVEKSTVPCGTATHLQEIFSSLGRPGVRFDILSNPEFLAEGTAITNLLHPDRILIGSLRDTRALEAAQALADVYATWVPRERIITINLFSSELAKLAANCMLAQRISSMNSLSALCEATGADIDELAYAVGLDQRIGPKMLKASAGFGGSCFKKDVLSLVFIAESYNLPEVASYWQKIVDINEYQRDRFAKRITKRLHNTLSYKKIAILGFAYKKDTGDTRESVAISVVGQLIAENARLAIYDPKVSKQQIMKDLSQDHAAETVTERVSVCDNVYDACEGAYAVVILTEWDEFKTDHVPAATVPLSRAQQEVWQDRSPITDHSSDHESTSHSCGSSFGERARSSSPASSISVPDDVEESMKPKPQRDGRTDWSYVAKTTRRPRLLFDGRNIVDPPRLTALGFKVSSIGKS